MDNIKYKEITLKAYFNLIGYAEKNGKYYGC